MSDLFGQNLTLDVLAKAMQADALNQKLIANNIANVDTPGYHRLTLSFKSQLRKFLNQTQEIKGVVDHPNDLPIGSPTSLKEVQPEVFVDNTTMMRPDGNNVDIDKEMADLEQNSGDYQTLARLVAMKLAIYRTAITG
jgi:flagellar basal-body rod protein FlgB